MDPTGQQAIDNLYRQAAEQIAQNGPDAATAAARSPHLYESFTGAAQTLDHATFYGVLPLCFALLVLHENYRSQTEGGGFGLTRVLGRIVAVVALLLAYGSVCRLITGVAGGHGGWMTSDHLASVLDGSGAAIGSSWDNINEGHTYHWEDVSSLPKFLAVLFVWAVVVMAALFAYVAGLLLSLAQAALLVILLSVGKTCITVSLVPGVGVGKGWAKSLAMVAAWSTVAGIVTGLLVSKSGSIKHLIAGAELVPLLKVAAQFVVLGICTLAIPKITSGIFSGAASHAPGVVGALAMGWAGARMATRSVTRSVSSVRSGEKLAAGGAGAREGGLRAQKMRFGQLAGVTGAVLAPAALAVDRIARHRRRVGRPIQPEATGDEPVTAPFRRAASRGGA